MIEQLPVELRDRFTDMREMDLQVQSELDLVVNRYSVHCMLYNVRSDCLCKPFFSEMQSMHTFLYVKIINNYSIYCWG